MKGFAFDMKKNYRMNRINDEMKKELCEIIRAVKDPRVNTAFVSITAVDCAADLKTAKIYFSSIGTMNRDDIKRGLVSASGFIRYQLAQRLNLRMTPELTFISDASLERGTEISRLLHEIEIDLAEKDAREASEVAEDTENE